MIGCLPTQALAFLAVFVYATQAIAFEWKPGFRVDNVAVVPVRYTFGSRIAQMSVMVLAGRAKVHRSSRLDRLTRQSSGRTKIAPGD